MSSSLCCILADRMERRSSVAKLEVVGNESQQLVELSPSIGAEKGP